VNDKPARLLAQLLELTVDALELGTGVQRLDLVFVDGRLRSWSTSATEGRPAYKLARYDRAIDWRGLRETPPAV
jgi:hypothetical protein